MVDYEADEEEEEVLHANGNATTIENIPVPSSNKLQESSDDLNNIDTQNNLNKLPVKIHANNENEIETVNVSKRKFEDGNHDHNDYDVGMTKTKSQMQHHEMNSLPMASPPKRARLDKSAATRMVMSSIPGRPQADHSRVSAPKGTTGGMDPKVITSGSSSFGIYIPPFRRKQLELIEKEKQQQENEMEQRRISEGDAGGEQGPDDDDEKPIVTIATPNAQIQRQKWEALKKAINGTINRLNTNTIKDLIHGLFQKANLIRGKGLLAKSLLRAATTSPTYAPVYASLLAVINTKLPEIGELVLVRAILTFRRSYARQDRGTTMSITNFMGCLFNQGLCHELLCLQLLTVLLEGEPTDDSVEVAVQFIKVVGMALLESSPAGIHAVMERFRGLLHDGRIGRRVQYKIEELMKIRRDRFRAFPALQEELDLVEREEQITFELGLDDEGLKKEDGLDVFRYDPDWGANEQDWVEIRREILGEDSDDEESGSGGESETDDDESGNESDDSDDDEDGVLQEAAPVAPITQATSTQITEIHDMSEKDLINLRRTIYLTIMSSATFEECSHKLSKMDIPVGKEMELINMVIECCSQERTFLRYYGLIAARFCLMHKRWSDAFLQAFIDQYNTIHRLETNKLRNVAKMFAHLLHTDSLSWSCLAAIHLNEDETTSSSRIFLKILVQEMAAAMGIGTLVKRFEPDDPETLEWFKELFPKDNPRKTRYAINFFTSIGLGPLTDGLREHLKNAPKLIMQQAQAEAEKLKAKEGDDSDESSVLSSSSSDSSSVSSSSMSSSSGSYSSYSTYSSDDSYTSSSESSYYRRRGRSRRRRGSSGDKRGNKGRRNYSSDSSVSTSDRDSISRSPGKSNRSVSKSRSRSRSKSKSGAKRKSQDSSIKNDSSASKNRRKSSPIGSEIEIQLDAKGASPSQKSVEKKKKRRSSRTNSISSRSNSRSPSSSTRGSERGTSPQRRRSRKRSYSRSPSRGSSRDRSGRRSVPQKKSRSTNRRSNYL